LKGLSPVYQINIYFLFFYVGPHMDVQPTLSGVTLTAGAERAEERLAVEVVVLVGF
jgi:hypothetical protein